MCSRSRNTPTPTTAYVLIGSTMSEKSRSRFSLNSAATLPLWRSSRTATNRADLSIAAESHFWSARIMEYREIRYTIRAGIERGRWFVAIHPDAGVEVAGNKIMGTREDAEFYAHRMISRWLEPKSRQRINRKR